MTSQPLLAIPDKAANRLPVQLLRATPPMPPGNRVYHVTDEFECNGKRWRLRFQSWVRKPQQGDARLPSLLDVFPEDHPNYKEPTPPPQGSSLRAKVAWMGIRALHRAAKKQRETGWHLKLAGGGVEGWFDLAKLPKESSEKCPYASFQLERDGTAYWCQFHILERPWPREKPTAWDHSRGAKAGLPTLGKRR